MAAAAPRRIEIVPWGFWKSATAGMIRSAGGGNLSGGSFISAGGINNEIIWDVTLDSGTWAIDVIYNRDNNRGIGTLYLDSTSLGTIDFYGATGASNLVGTVSGITVAAAGSYSLKIKAESKNASSSGYYQILHLVVLRRTGA